MSFKMFAWMVLAICANIFVLFGFVSAPDYETVGCFQDRPAARAIGTLEEGQDAILDGDYQTRANAINKCYQAAKKRGFTVFAVQDGGWCAASATAAYTFNKYGPSSACNADGKGGKDANQVYFIITGYSLCHDTDWRQALSKPGWVNCSDAYQYVNGLLRDSPNQPDGIDRILGARCCQFKQQPVHQAPLCKLVDWSALLSRNNQWATCPDGFFLQGIYRSNDTWLHNIERAKCCKPQNLEESYEKCYNQDVLLYFDKAGLSRCKDNYAMVGLYRGTCDKLSCIDTFKCCKAHQETGILGHWLLNGQETDIRYDINSTFIEGRCPGSNALSYDQFTPDSVAQAPIVNFVNISFTIACWIKLNASAGNMTGAIYSDWVFPLQFSLTLQEQNIVFYRHSYSQETQWALKSTTIPLHTWVHVAVTWRQKLRTVQIYADGRKIADRAFGLYTTFYEPTGKDYQIGNNKEGQQFPGAVMELYLFGSALSKNNLDRLRGFPVITSSPQVKGRTVLVTWETPFEGACPVSVYSVYYRVVTSEVDAGQWTSVNVTESAHSLILQCRKEYQITVTAWSSSGETPVNHSNPWNVSTGGEPPLPPVIENKEVEIEGCHVNLTWSASRDNGCPLTMYTIYYQETAGTENYQLNWANITMTSVLIPLECDKQYEFEISAWNGVGQSDKSRLWPIKTTSGTTAAMKNPTAPGFDGLTTGLIVGSIALFILLLVAVFYRRRQKKKKRKKQALLSSTPKRSKSDIVVLQHWETPPEQVTFMEEVGRGAFGVVFKGLLNQSAGIEVFFKASKQTVEFREGRTVAIKVLGETASEESREQFLEEIELMKRVGTHRNVLSMVGFWVKSAPIYLLLEYVPHGDLLQWLRNMRIKRLIQKRPETLTVGVRNGEGTSVNEQNSTQVLPSTIESDVNPQKIQDSACLVGNNETSEDTRPPEATTPTKWVSNLYEDAGLEDDVFAKDLLCFAWQIARGMSFLSSRGFIHRDLAARNVLLGDDKTIKISDFGLMRHIYGDIYEMDRRKKLPIKWMAPEALYSSIYTSQSDVWSFGVLIWELSTMGGIPYPGIDNKELYKLLKTSFRLEKPDTCSDDLYVLMSDCWKEEPSERPTFEQLAKVFEEMMTNDTPYLDLESLDESKACYAEKLSDSDVSESTL